MNSKPKKPSKSNNVFYIGLLSFFGGISQDIFKPILPIYLANVLGLDKSFIGLTEGIVTASVSLFRILSGYLSDKYKKNKAIVFTGYFLSMISRALLVFFTGGAVILGLRGLDGIGKGVKDSAKDALIAGSTEMHNRGRGFGVARMLDTLGSVVGPIALFALLYLLRNNALKYHYILLICAAPLILTLSILVLKVKEVNLSTQNTTAAEKIKGKKPGILPAAFWWFLVVMVFFSIGNSSDAFLILRAENTGVTILTIPLVYALFNFVYAAASVPLGSLSDKIGRAKVILIGFIAYTLAYFGFGLATQAWHIWILFSVYGLYYATTEGVAKAFIADLIDPSYRGRAYGIYNALIGVVALPASLIAGILWDKINPAAPFLFGAGIALLGSLFLLIYTKVFSLANNKHTY